MIIKIILMFATIALLSGNAEAIQFSKYYLIGKKGEPTAILLTNNAEVPAAVKITFDDETARQIPGGSPSCAESMRAFPKAFILNPGQVQLVKFVGKKDGYCRVRFAVVEDKPVQAYGDGNIMSINIRTGLPVYIGNDYQEKRIEEEKRYAETLKKITNEGIKRVE